jgi:hypothetical protein
MLKIIQIIAILILVACVSSPRAPTDYSVYAKTYESACAPKATLTIDVEPPHCISSRHEMDEGFDYDFQFHGCRISVENFVSALDTFTSCKISSSIDTFDKVIADTEDLLDCYETHLNSLKNGTIPLVECSPVSVPESFYISVHFPADLSLNFGPVMVDPTFKMPYCAESKIPINIEKPWVYSHEVESCKERLEEYLSNSWSSPQSQRERYINDLIWRISSYKERAVEVFNCKAERGTRCENKWNY